MRGENAHLTDDLAGTVFVVLLDKPAIEARTRNVRSDRAGKSPAACHPHGIIIDVRRKDLDSTAGLVPRHGLFQEDRDRIGLLSSRAARYPYPDRVVGPAFLDQIRNDMPFQRFERVAVTEELGDVDQKVAE